MGSQSVLLGRTSDRNSKLGGFVRVQVLGGSPPHLSRDGIGPIGMLLPDLGILVDYGIGHRRLPEGEAVITPFPIPADQEIRYVILTHIHNDHAGLVPWVMKRFPKAELVTTLPTLELGRAVWSDLHAIGRRRGYPGLVPWNTSLYEEICRRTIIVREPGWTHLAKGARVYFGPNGHVRGSAYVVIESDGKRVAWSGDVSYYDTPTVLEQIDAVPHALGSFPLATTKVSRPARRAGSRHSSAHRTILRRKPLPE